MRAAPAPLPSLRPALAGTTRPIARAAIRALWQELALHPKPGLVSLRDAGAHDDMTAATFIRSLFSLSRFFDAVSEAGAAGARFDVLRCLGIEAEAAMLAATQGVNTHRGAIFALGLLCATAARVAACNDTPTDATLRRVLLAQWGTDLAAPSPCDEAPTHGMQAARRYGASGARGEAERAFPAVFAIALPTLREAVAQGCDARHAQLSAFFALLAHVEDTNILHRGGIEGLAYVHRVAREFRDAGDVYATAALSHAEAIHAEFVSRRLSPGGCADLLAAALFVNEVQRMLQ